MPPQQYILTKLKGKILTNNGSQEIKIDSEVIQNMRKVKLTIP